MVPFTLAPPARIPADIAPGRQAPAEAAARVAADPAAAFLAGGTTMADLMKLNVLTPGRIEYVRPALSAKVEERADDLRIGAACTIAALADHPAVRSQFPAVRHTLILAASPQIRNMATVAGNLLQRSRCPYYRHPDWDDNPIAPDPTADGADRSMAAVLGVTAPTAERGYTPKYPGDMAAAMAAFDASVETVHPDGGRTIAVRDLHVKDAPAPHASTVLRQGELITHLVLPKSAAAVNSWYFKVRERSSYAFALASAAVGLELDGSGPTATVKDVKIGLGGVASRPWHAAEAEAALVGRPATDANFAAAATAAFASARVRPDRAPAGQEWKVTLGERTLAHALTYLRDHGPPDDATLFAMQHGREA